MQDILAQFADKRRKFVLHNAGDTEVVIEFWAETLRVPPRDAVQLPHPRNPNKGRCSAKFPDGSYVPGTLVVEDESVEDPRTGEYRVVFDAGRMVKVKLGVQPDGTAIGDYYLRGISVLPDNPTHEDVKLVMEQGLARWKSWQMKAAHDKVAAFEARNDARKRAGMAEIPPSTDYAQAYALVAEVRQRDAKKAQEILDSVATKTPAELSQDEANFRDYVSEKLGKIVAEQLKDAPEVDTAKTVSNLMEDPNVMAEMAAQYERKRRRGV